MSWKSLSRLLSGLKGAYNDINPATLTGAIDVIVVEQQDGSFTCGPFHVRFGKLTAFSPADKTVEVYVNGEYVDFLRMCLGSAGDAYFVNSSGPVADEFLISDTVDCRGFTLDDSWSELSMRRRPRKVRRDSAMSEPGTESNVMNENVDETCEINDYDVSSDCESPNSSVIGSIRDRNAIGNKSVSDSQLDESSKVAVRQYTWDWDSRSLTKSQSSSNNSDASNTVENAHRDYGTTQGSKHGNQMCGKELYLEDLVTAEVDQNIKEAYIYPPSHGSVSHQSHSYGPSNATDSGYIDHGYRSDNEHSPRSMSPISPQIVSFKLSLCGGLSPENVCSEEKFLEHIVSYEEFIHNPSAILSNPNLVVYFNGRYCNWQVAAPSIVSVLAFQTHLPYLTLQRLESQYLPKKQPRRTSWFCWGASHLQTAATEPEPILQPKKEKDKPYSSNYSCSEPIQESSNQPMTGVNRLSSNEVARLKLKPGRNDIEFRVTTKYQGTCTCSASIYYWHWYDRIVVSDVDGTITRSDLLGHLLPMLGHDWTHSGVARLYNRIRNNGYQFLYLSARALGQAGITRSYLRQVVQDSASRLPDGPILVSPNSLLHAFHQEVIINKPEVFKIQCLQNVCDLFPKSYSPLYAGFGNKVNDVFAYQKAGIELCRIFTINPRGEVRNEYQCLRSTTYQELSDTVDLYFPSLSNSQAMPISYSVEFDCNSRHTSEKLTTLDGRLSDPSFDVIPIDLSTFSSFSFWKSNFELSFPPPELSNNS